MCFPVAIHTIDIEFMLINLNVLLKLAEVRMTTDHSPIPSLYQSVLRLVTVEIQIASNAKSILYKVGWGGGFLNFYIKSGKGPDNTGTMLFVN